MAKGQRLRGAKKRAGARLRSARAALALARKRFRLTKGNVALRRAAVRKKRGQAIKARRNWLKYEKALRAYRQYVRQHPYPHLSGDLDANHEVLERLENLAVRIGRNIYVTSGLRTQAQQKALYDNRASNPFPVAFCCPCSSQHCLGRAADALVGGVPIQNAVSAATISSVGLYALPGDAVHVQLR